MEQNKIKIGIVDDHQLILDGLEKLLKSVENYEVVFIENKASVALQYMENNPVDLVISDVAMPDMNGAEFIKKLKQHHPKVKILVLSMYKTDLIDENDINGYLLKESSSETILKKVNDILTNEAKTHAPALDKSHSSLSKREKEIVIEIGHGLSSEQIAEKLFLSYYTVETHKKNIYLKLNVKTTAELIKKAIYIGIIT
ncbi:response regulator transcription factor [Moheibacter sediminis]|uniref:Two component transcriptional regulator, LuxR family n=1 Tax=Moheibacter sediminis TaxID=1434700 RepID=A0A1W1YAB6_9FLAO|nr:response regulator transcription factor [Moheibacter sediminis]SMC33095.1 two component transcriptional regulator, LuxR family [Moheibacter sediminis]